MSPERFDAAMACVLRGAAPDGLAAALGGDVERLRRYLGHYRAACVERLAAEYPGLRAALGAASFAARAIAYAEAAAPAFDDSLRFGQGFTGWLSATEESPPPWLLEVADLDWRMEACARAPILPGMDREALGAVRLTANCGLTLDPAAAWIRATSRISDWYADMLAGQAPAAPAAGGELIEVRRDGRRVGLRALDPGSFALREALAAGESFGDAAEAARAADIRLDLAAALSDLADERLVVAVRPNR